MSFFGFGQSVEVEIVLHDAESRKRAEHKTEDGKKEKYFLFYDGETVSGKVSLALKHPNKRLEHQGIKIEFIGQIGESASGASLPHSLPPPIPPHVLAPRQAPTRGGTPGRPGEACGALSPLRSEPRPRPPLRYGFPCPKGQRATRRSGAQGPSWWPAPRPRMSSCPFYTPLRWHRHTKVSRSPLRGFRSEMPTQPSLQVALPSSWPRVQLVCASVAASPTSCCFLDAMWERWHTSASSLTSPLNFLSYPCFEGTALQSSDPAFLST